MYLVEIPQKTYLVICQKCRGAVNKLIATTPNLNRARDHGRDHFSYLHDGFDNPTITIREYVVNPQFEEIVNTRG